MKKSERLVPSVKRQEYAIYRSVSSSYHDSALTLTYNSFSGLKLSQFTWKTEITVSLLVLQTDLYNYHVAGNNINVCFLLTHDVLFESLSLSRFRVKGSGTHVLARHGVEGYVRRVRGVRGVRRVVRGVRGRQQRGVGRQPGGGVRGVVVVQLRVEGGHAVHAAAAVHAALAARAAAHAARVHARHAHRLQHGQLQDQLQTVAPNRPRCLKILP